MSGLRRREAKGADDASATADALDSRLEYAANPEQAFSIIPGLLRSANPDSRLSGIRALNAQLTARYFGEEIEDAASSILTALNNSLTDHCGPGPEHTEALVAVCNLSLQFFSSFELYATTIIDELLPTIASLSAGCDFRIWAIQFLAAFSFTPESTVPRTVLAQILNLLTNKKARGAEYTPEIMIEGIRGLNLLLATLPVEIIVSEFLDNVLAFVDHRLTSKKPAMVLAALDTVLIVHEVLVKYGDAAEEGEAMEAEARLKLFLGAYQQKFNGLSKQAVKKNDQKMIKSRCSEIVKIFDGETCEEELILNSQTKVISGPRDVTALAAIRRLAGSRFEQQMSGNPAIHQYFDIQLMTRTEVQKFKRKHKVEIQQGRVLSKRENERKVAAQRKKKEDAAYAEPDE
jgi:hypothetical protein